jgi:hypothetical protein
MTKFGPYRVTATTVSSTLQALLTAAGYGTIPTGAARWLLVPVNAGAINYAPGAADATKPAVPSGGLSEPVNDGVVGTTQFYAANVQMDVSIFG